MEQLSKSDLTNPFATPTVSPVVVRSVEQSIQRIVTAHASDSTREKVTLIEEFNGSLIKLYSSESDIGGVIADRRLSLSTAQHKRAAHEEH